MLSPSKWAGRLSSKRFFLTIILIFSAAYLYLWRLGDLTAGYSQSEKATIYISNSARTLLNQPLDLPHNSLQLLFRDAGLASPFYMRSVSAIFAVIFLYSFYTIARNWFGKIIGLLGTLIFASSPIFILLARSSSAGILYFWPLLIISLFYWLCRTTNHKDIAVFTLIVGAFLGLYIPMMSIFIILAAAVSFPRLNSELKRASKLSVGLGFFVGLLFLTPLLRSIALSPVIAKSLFLLPSTWVGFKEFFSSMGWAVVGVFWRTRQHYEIIVGRLPLINLVQSVLALFGLIAMWQQAKKELLWLLAIFVGGILVSGFSHMWAPLAGSSIATAFFMCAGLRYLYIEWRSVFPRNPIPKTLAIVLMSVLVLSQVAYGWRYALYAWPNSATTKSIYVLK